MSIRSHLTIAFVGSMVGTLSAQSAPWRVDLSAGLTRPSWSTASPGGDHPSTPTVGIRISRAFLKNFGLAAELNLTRKGDRSEFVGTDIEGNPFPLRTTTTVTYLTLPLLVRVAPATGRVRPEVFIGPELAIQVGCQLRDQLPSGDGGWIGDAHRCWSGLQDAAQFDVHRFDGGLVAGAGVQVDRWALSFRYTHGLRDVLQRPIGFEGQEPRNRIVQLALSYRIKG